MAWYANFDSLVMVSTRRDGHLDGRLLMSPHTSLEALAPSYSGTDNVAFGLERLTARV